MYLKNLVLSRLVTPKQKLGKLAYEQGTLKNKRMDHGENLPTGDKKLPSVSTAAGILAKRL